MYEKCRFCGQEFHGSATPQGVDQNAYLLLCQHVSKEHSDIVFDCPRGGGLELSNYPKTDFWRDDNTCSYCGSMHPDDFMKLVEAGEKLVPTDKNYKVYVMVPNEKVGERKIIGGESGQPFGADGKPRVPDLTPEEIEANFYRRDIWGTEESYKQEKFYFQHLNNDQKIKFVELLNAKKIQIGYPGFFYQTPFFITYAKPSDLSS